VLAFTSASGRSAGLGATCRPSVRGPGLSFYLRQPAAIHPSSDDVQALLTIAGWIH
jgi:hypothetical protein